MLQAPQLATAVKALAAKHTDGLLQQLRSSGGLPALALLSATGNELFVANWLALCAVSSLCVLQCGATPLRHARSLICTSSPQEAG